MARTVMLWAEKRTISFVGGWACLGVGNNAHIVRGRVRGKHRVINSAAESFDLLLMQNSLVLVIRRPLVFSRRVWSFPEK